MKINIHAGHNPANKVACGAVGLLDESTENRNVVKELKAILEKEGHTVYICTCDNGTSVSDVINKIVAKSNANTVDLDISIHFNAGVNDKVGNGKSCGTECLIYNTSNNKEDKEMWRQELQYSREVNSKLLASNEVLAKEISSKLDELLEKVEG